MCSVCFATQRKPTNHCCEQREGEVCFNEIDSLRDMQ
jgi:hypothetical protein